MATKKEEQKVVLEASTRSTSGKGPAKVMRREGLIPAVVYGDKKASLPIQISAGDLTRALHTKAGENVLLTLRLDAATKKKDAKEAAVLIKDLQHHPVSRQVIHADFYRVSLTKKITVNVPLNFKGEAIGVKQEGGVMEHLRWELEVECLPTEIPAEIIVPIDDLALGKSLHVKDVALPAGVQLLTDPEQPVVACVAPRVEEEPAPVEEAAEGEEPEVLKQKSPEEIAAEDAEAKAKEGEAEAEDKKKEAKKE